MDIKQQTLEEDLKKVLNKPTTVNNSDEIAKELAAVFYKFVKEFRAVGVDTRGDSHNLKLN
ncbi:conserved hypothetical protein [Tenacibaculum sp. 190524A02b]|uniref:Uncharacterized protein n=1 Tax=Tenacibaculum vairaonense TaxID=3137860 RepID=A0ABP1FCT5_9FLAO